MKSVLEEFTCENISPEPRFIKHNFKYETAVKDLSDAKQNLLNALLEAQGAVTPLAN